MSNFRTSSGVALTVLISSYNRTRVLPLVEDEMHPIIPEQAEVFAGLESPSPSPWRPCRASRQSAPCPPSIRHRPDRPHERAPLLWRVLDARMSSRPSRFSKHDNQADSTSQLLGIVLRAHRSEGPLYHAADTNRLGTDVKGHRLLFYRAPTGSSDSAGAGSRTRNRLVAHFEYYLRLDRYKVDCLL
jgi:hypothetical protein